MRGDAAGSAAAGARPRTLRNHRGVPTVHGAARRHWPKRQGERPLDALNQHRRQSAGESRELSKSQRCARPVLPDTGAQYSVFIEHALGRGEATCQRFVRRATGPFNTRGRRRSAIDAAIAERDAGVLPGMVLWGADIGKADTLRALRAQHRARGAVMMVGNGFQGGAGCARWGIRRVQGLC